MRDILQATGRFRPENFFYQDDAANSSDVKPALAKFIDELRGKHEVWDEVFFYFSGHGAFDGNDFFFVLSDYEADKLNQTCLGGGELDGMLRSLSPKLSVKNVDACESAISYIKSAEDIVKNLENSKNKFNACYFMFSSMQDQSSYQDQNLSYFTRSWVNSLLGFENKSIRYRDIVSSIADEFGKDSRQKPFFVIQASNTEVFAEITDDILNILKHKSNHLLAGSVNRMPITAILTATLPSPTLEATAVVGDTERSLTKLELLRQSIVSDEKKFCTEAEANSMFEHVKQCIFEANYPDFIRDFFKIEPVFYKDSFEALPSMIQIAQWLQSRGSGFFVNLINEEVMDNSPFPFGYMPGRGRPTRSVLKSFDTTVQQPPFRCTQIKAIPCHLNLPMWCCYIAYVTSKTEMRSFYTTVKYVDKNWQERMLVGEVKWKTCGFPLKSTSKAHSFVSDTLAEFAMTIEADLLERFNVPRDLP